MARRHEYYVAEQCSHYVNGNPCRTPATFLVVAPDGEAVPGGYSCTEHACATVLEYADKLGESWSLHPLVRVNQTSEPVRRDGSPLTTEAPR